MRDRQTASGRGVRDAAWSAQRSGGRLQRAVFREPSGALLLQVGAEGPRAEAEPALGPPEDRPRALAPGPWRPGETAEDPSTREAASDPVEPTGSESSVIGFLLGQPAPSSAPRSSAARVEVRSSPSGTCEQRGAGRTSRSATSRSATSRATAPTTSRPHAISTSCFRPWPWTGRAPSCGRTTRWATGPTRSTWATSTATIRSTW